MPRFITHILPAFGKSLRDQAKALVAGGVDAWLVTRRQQEKARLRASLEPRFPELSGMTLWPSRSKTDTGRWWRPARIWLGQEGDQWVFLAAGPRPLRQALSTDLVRSARYNHVTGQLVFHDQTSGQTFSLKLQPEPAYRLLTLIQSRKEPTYA
ncbi:MAG: hypothetical protein JJT75_02660 [Opitutales bacterium]|nr:hypothetical protein [Opitutales bacterium]MCH8539835.1 hypothetical protein [Opitutales bacterium]